MRRSILRMSLVIFLGGVALAGTSQTSAIAASVDPAPTAVPAPFPGGNEAGTDATLSTDGSPETSASAPGCYFDNAGSYVHVSSTPTPREASGHGWWVNGNCPTTKATVTVQLQEFYSDGSWRNNGTKGKATVVSGGGSGNWAIGRAGCTTTGITGWRSVIDVDLVNLSDDNSVLITSAQNIACRR